MYTAVMMKMGSDKRIDMTLPEIWRVLNSGLMVRQPTRIYDYTKHPPKRLR